MALPWYRMDVGWFSHDKVLALLDDRAPAAIKYRAVLSWAASIGWSLEHETDGRIPRSAFVYLHANDATARLLVKHHLWDEEPPGYVVHNYARRQPMSATVHALRDDRRRAGAKAACLRWHGADCWVEPDGCTRETT